jgi:6-pyruvoyltetrahydropterin/6-carboxytetrahydropterin synthase
MLRQITLEPIQSMQSEPSDHSFMHCIRRVQFCAGHRVWKHESKCAHLHGHNYVAFFHAAASALDDLGRVIDFAELKNRLGGWIDANWDHGFILNREDREAIEAVQSIPGQKLYLVEGNPTAENLARHLLTSVAPGQMADVGVQVVKVILWETENSYVEAVL